MRQVVGVKQSMQMAMHLIGAFEGVAARLRLMQVLQADRHAGAGPLGGNQQHAAQFSHVAGKGMALQESQRACLQPLNMGALLAVVPEDHVRRERGNVAWPVAQRGQMKRLLANPKIKVLAESSLLDQLRQGLMRRADQPKVRCVLPIASKRPILLFVEQP